jgi:hypothetical protein
MTLYEAPMTAPELTQAEQRFLLDRTIPGELGALELADDDFDLILRGLEVRAIAAFVQMHGKLVCARDATTPYRFVGRVFIEHINGDDGIDFTDRAAFKAVTIDSISIAINSCSSWGPNAKRYSALRQIKEVRRFEDQPEG